MDPKTIITYLFKSPKETYNIILLVFLPCLLFVGGFVLAFIRKKFLKGTISYKLIRKYPFAMKTFGIIGLIIVFFRIEKIGYLNARILFLAYILIFIIYTLKSVSSFIGHYNFKKRNILKTDKIDKYLPQKKTKRKKGR